MRFRAVAFDHQENIDVLLDEVAGISAKQCIVHLKHRGLTCDVLILVIGIRYYYFGPDEWRRFAPASNHSMMPT
jgi:NADH dehydrogenase FAD-containing subunit